VCVCVSVCLPACEMSLRVRCESQAAPLLLTKQEVCFFNRVVYLAVTGPVSLSGLGEREERAAL